tara:strand:+ start:1194 stop:2063 length:870 start_codon:yes stop_codon:yes gene_type:complete
MKHIKGESVRLEDDTRYRQRMEAIGALTSGIAHEIHTPLQYVGDNLRFLYKNLDDLLSLLDIQQKLVELCSDHSCSKGKMEAYKKEYVSKDIAFLREEMPLALNQSLEGIAIITKIIRAMREIAYPSCSQHGPVGINRVIERACVISQCEWKHAIKLIVDLDENLPEIEGNETAINQVLLNLIINAAHAIKSKKDKSGNIILRSRLGINHVRLEVEDTGVGIPAEVRHCLFDPTFTTKKVGEGSGQGLAIVHEIVVNEHSGSIQIESQEGAGTTVIISFPLGGEMRAKC